MTTHVDGPSLSDLLPPAHREQLAAVQAPPFSFGSEWDVPDVSGTWRLSSGPLVRSGWARDEGSNVLTLRTRVINDSSSAVTLPAVVPFVMAMRPTQPGPLIRSFGGGLTDGYFPPRAYAERVVSAQAGSYLDFAVRSGDDGRSSNRDLPIVQLHCPEGDAGFIVALEWSGEWWQRLVSPRIGHSDLSWTAGIAGSDLVLEPGEELCLPVVHLLAYLGSYEAGADQFRSYIASLMPTLADRKQGHIPVSYDHWFGIESDIDEVTLLAQLEVARQVAVEYFVLDAGWFAGCGTGSDFSTGVGNWEVVDRSRFPRGLEWMAEQVREAGLKFGLWFEPERAHRDSDWFVRHPELFLDIGEDYLLLDLSLPASQDLVIEVVGDYVSRLGLSWIRWDFNIGPAPYWRQTDPTGKLQFRYTEGLYRVLDSLIERHPGLLIEACASGGRRIDLGTLRRAHTAWFSDHTVDPRICRYMQAGGASILPAAVLNSAVAIEAGEGVTPVTSYDLVARMGGALALNGDIASWSAESIALTARHIEVFKSIRHVLDGEVRHLNPLPSRPSDPIVVQYRRPETGEVVVIAHGVTPAERQMEIVPRLDSQDYELIDELTGDRRPVTIGGAGSVGLRIDLSDGAAVLRLVPSAATPAPTR